MKRIIKGPALFLAVLMLVMNCLFLTAYADESSDAQVSDTSQASGEENADHSDVANDGQMNLDVVFVLDASGSMTKSDPKKIAIDAYRLFVDLLDDSCGIGYVVYTHEIIEKGDIVDVSDKAGLEATKKKMASIKYDLDGFTDIALGLTEAKDILTDKKYKDDHRQKVIILLTDGNTALPKEGRPLDEADAEMEATLMTLYDRQIPVYSIGLNYNGKMKAMSTLESIQNQVDDIKMQLGDENVMTTGCYIYELSDDQCSVAYGDCYVSSLLDSARVTNVLAEDDNGFVGIDMLLKSNPDVIFCDTGIADKIAGNEDLRSLKALDSGKIFTLPKKYVQLQGKTRIITVDYIADKAHDSYQSTQKWPEEFQDAAEKYVPPFTPKEGIYYTVGETYKNIKDVEERLISLGYMEGTADETFTEDTANAVKYFQSMNNLEVTGIADYKTLSVLLSDKALANNGSGNDEVTVEY